MNKRIVAVLIFILPCVGCVEQQPEPESNGSLHRMSVPSKEIEQPGDEGEFTVKLTAYEEFVVLCSEKWIRLKDIGGEAPEWELVFSISRNESKNARKGEITVADNHEELCLNVTQGNYHRLCVLNDAQFVSDEASSFELMLLHDVDVDFEVPDWISFERKEARGRYFFNVAANESYEERCGTVKVTSRDGRQSAEVTVTQRQKNAIVLSDKVVSFNKDGGSFDVLLKANVDFDLKVTAPDWLISVEQTVTKSMKEFSSSWTVSANSSRFDRRAELVYFNYDYNLADSVHVMQSGVESVLKICYNGKHFEGLSVEGDALRGVVYWGDGSSEEISNQELSHSYVYEAERELKLDTHNSTGFRLNNIVDINSVDLSEFMN